MVPRVSANFAFCKLIDELHVGKAASHHNLMVAATRTIRVEFGLLDAVFAQITRRRRIRRDCPGGRKMVGCHKVTEIGEGAGTG